MRMPRGSPSPGALSNAATTVSAIPSNAYVASDRAADSIYYASFDSAFYCGSGTSYTANTATGYPNGTYKIKAVPGRQGHVWVPAGTHGLWVTKDGGKSFSKLDTSVVQKADIIGYGKAATGQTYPALYITGKVLHQTGNYLPVFVLASLAYIVALLIVHLIVPKLEAAQIEERIV